MVNSCLAGSLAVALPVLGVAGWLDARFREVDPELWYGPLILSLPLGACYALRSAGGLALVFYVAGLAFWAVMAVLYVLGLIGGADVLATLLVVLSLPAPPRPGPGLGLLPPVIPVLLIATLAGLAYRFWAVARVYGLGRALRGLEVTVEARRLLEDRALLWWVPRGVGVEEEWAWELVSVRGRVRAGPGSPLVTMMFIGVLAYLGLVLAGL